MARKPFPRPGRRAGTDARSGCGAAARSGRRSDLRRRQRAELSDRPDNQEHMTALSFKDLLAAIEGRSADFRDAASRSDPAARVPGCPDWSLADLVAHLGEVQRFWATVVMAGPSPTPPADDLVIGREPQGDLLAWSAAGTDALIRALSEAGPDRGCWTWWAASGAPMTAAAVARHQMQEAAVHSFDAQETGGSAGPVPADMAADCLGEFLTVTVPMSGTWPHEPARLTLEAAGSRAWLVDLSRERTLAQPAGSVQAEPPPAAAARGSASDIVLALYGRRPAEILDITGSRPLIEQFLAWPDSD
jgi:uncharacterized protein (TIGR03083 family)